MTILDTIGNTPLIKINEDVWMKLEGFNPFGSIKDRAAIYIIEKGLEKGYISQSVGIIESSSGNFGIALAGICNIKNIKFTCVIDPLITEVNKKILEIYKANIIMANNPDKNGSYVKERIKLVQKFISTDKNVYWPNQYDNLLICEAYEKTIAKEFSYLDKIDFVFVAVSTGGTITGISRGIKRLHPNVKIIAVDTEGSKIFETKDSIKLLTGIGASFKPNNLNYAFIDDVVIVNNSDSINGCIELLNNGLFCGGSSGSVYAAYKIYSHEHKITGKKSVCILPDRGERYLDTVYNTDWRQLNKV